MTFDEYQDFCKSLIRYPTPIISGTLTRCAWMYPAMNLAGEAGEVASKFSHVIRDNNGEVTSKMRRELKKELGDVLWNIATLSYHLDYKLSDIVESNVKKLKDRKARGVLYGSGDNR